MQTTHEQRCAMRPPNALRRQKRLPGELGRRGFEPARTPAHPTMLDNNSNNNNHMKLASSPSSSAFSRHLRIIRVPGLDAGAALRRQRHDQGGREPYATHKSNAARRVPREPRRQKRLPGAVGKAGGRWTTSRNAGAIHPQNVLRIIRVHGLRRQPHALAGAGGQGEENRTQPRA